MKKTGGKGGSTNGNQQYNPPTLRPRTSGQMKPGGKKGKK